MPTDKTRKKLTIEIDNLTEAQAQAIESLFSVWQSLGSMGSSKWTSFFADGDGNFQPKITVDGRKPEHSPVLPEKECWKGMEYRIDFDSIAWRLHDEGK